MSQLELLQQNLHAYVSKRYLNELIKGSIITGTVLLSSWLCVSVMEYFFHFSSNLRTVLFFTFLAFALSVFFFQVALPLLRYLRILRPIEDKVAAESIGRSFSGIDDKLKNTLELRDQLIASPSLLAQASLLQRAGSLNQITFSNSISFQATWRLMRYFILPVSVFGVLSFAFPDMILDSSRRVVNFNENYTPPAPFFFLLVNDKMEVAEGSAFTVQIKTEGSHLPNQVFIETQAGNVRMRKVSNELFAYDFDRLMSSVNFKVNAAGVESENMIIEVLALPKFLRTTANLDFPAYTGLKDESLMNRSQIKVPVGTTIDWILNLKSVDQLLIKDSEEATILPIGEEPSVFSKKIKASGDIVLVSSNMNGLSDTSRISIQAVPDEFPGISVKEVFDSNDVSQKYFTGNISDDYGFTRMQFRADKVSQNQRVNILKESVPIGNSTSEQSFQYLYNLDSLILDPEDQIEYYFEVWDNDEINGAKSSKSRVWKFALPSEAEIKELNAETAKESKEAMAKQLSELDKLNKELDDFKKEVLQKKKTDWQDKEKLKSMLEKQKQAMEKLMKKAQLQRQQNQFNNRFQEYSPELLEKQETIQKMFDELFDDEFKKQYDEYNKMLEKLNKDMALDQVDKMKLDNEQLEKELDRTLELFKQLEFDQKLEENIKKTQELSKKQEELNEKTKDKSQSPETLAKQQEELKEELEELGNEMKKLEELNEALEEKKELPDTKNEQKSAEEKMEESAEEMKKNNRKKSSESQDDAQDSLEQMEDKLSSFQEQESQEQATENLEDMRQLLENLIDLSHQQESIMDQLKITKSKDPKFVEIAKAQKDIIDDTKVVEDSLLALSKRVPEIGRTINDEISIVKQSMDKALDNMTNQQPNQEKRYREMTAVNQQLSMTSLNNLAVMFDSMIQQMQKAENSKMKGTGQCNKPGSGKSGKPSVSDMKQMQKGLNDQIKKLKEAMEKGKSPNGKKPGQMPGTSGGSMSKELARMAAEQEAIREQLRELSNQIENEGGKPGSGLKKLQELMEQTEDELLYQDITQKTIDRQQEILNKLLESEKAERERELEEKRESKSSQNTFEAPSDLWEEYQIKKEQELELYKTLPPNLKPYYRKRVNRYFSQFSNQ